MLNKKSSVYRNSRLIDVVRHGMSISLSSAKVASGSVGSGGCLAYALGGAWGDEDDVVHFISSEGIFLTSNASSFKAEMIAAESALTFLQSLTQ